MCHRNDWPGSDWCALDIATTPEQTFHVLFTFIKKRIPSCIIFFFSTSAPQGYSRIERRKPRPGTTGEHRADAVDLIRRRLPETSRLEVDSVEPDMGNAAKPVWCHQRRAHAVSDPQRHPVAKTPRGIREPQIRENQTEELLPRLKKTVRSELRSDKTVACPLWYREMHSSRTLKAIQQKCLQQCARSKAEEPKSELSCGAERPSGAPRASAAIRRTRCLPLSCATTRIWHDNAPQGAIRKVSCETDVLAKTTNMHLSRAANQQPAVRNLQA